MDSSAVITQISKEEARGPLRGKGTQAAGGEVGAKGCPRAAAAATAPGASRARPSPSPPPAGPGKSSNSARVRGSGRGLAPLERSVLLLVGKLRQEASEGVSRLAIPGRRPLPPTVWRQRDWKVGVRRPPGHPMRLRPLQAEVWKGCRGDSQPGSLAGLSRQHATTFPQTRGVTRGGADATLGGREPLGLQDKLAGSGSSWARGTPAAAGQASWPRACAHSLQPRKGRRLGGDHPLPAPV